MKRLKLSTIIISILAVAFIVSIFILPSESIEAAKHGISLWFNTLFPAQFPFIAGANILIGVGAVNFLGVLLEPIMKPLFNIDGKGAFPFILGIISGCPVGAKITANLRQSNQISVYDANRIMSICNNSGPLFMLGTVSIGMFDNIRLGFYMIIVTYISALSTGLIYRFYGLKEKSYSKSNKNILKTAYRKQIENRLNNYKGLGTILSDSIMDSMETVAKIGGFVIFFSVISAILINTPIISIVEYILNPVFLTLNIDKSLYRGILLGIVEITNGIDIISSSIAPLKHQAIAVVCLMSWNGLSIHAQIISMFGNTDIKIMPYICSKLIQTLFAYIYGCILFPIIMNV